MKSSIFAARFQPGVALICLSLLLMVLASLPVSAAEEDIVRIHLIWTNDVHGYVDPRGATFMNPNFPPPLGGGASAAAYVSKLRTAIADDLNSGIVVVDAGDTWQGSPVGTLTEGRVMEEYYNTLGYDMVVPGNHEFDKGKNVPVRMSENLKQKMVSCNILDSRTGKLVEWCVPYRIVERGGLRIGLLGACTSSTAEMAFEDNIKDLKFAPILESLEKYRDILLSKEKVDIVFAVVHEGLPYDPEEGWKSIRDREAEGKDISGDIRNAMDLAHVLKNVPVMVGGHTHRGYQEPWIDPVNHTMVFETFGRGSSIGHAILKIDRRTHELVGYEAPLKRGTLITLFEDEWWPEKEMADALRPYLESVNEGLRQVVATSRVELTRRGRSNSPMGNLVTDAMREVLKADFAFSNTGGLRTELAQGNITEGDLLELLPFGNAASVVQMDGRMIREIIERKGGKNSSGFYQSGAQILVDPLAERGSRLLKCTIGGEPLEADRIYRVVTSDFLMEGNSGLDFLAQIDPDRVEYSGVLLRDALRTYLQAHTPVSPKIDDRFLEQSAGEMAAYLQNW